MMEECHKLKKCINRVENASKEIHYLAQGGTAVGTGINTKKNFDVKKGNTTVHFTGGTTDNNFILKEGSRRQEAPMVDRWARLAGLI